MPNDWKVLNDAKACETKNVCSKLRWVYYSDISVEGMRNTTKLDVVRDMFVCL
jgi:hypothetical protein